MVGNILQALAEVRFPEFEAGSAAQKFIVILKVRVLFKFF